MAEAYVGEIRLFAGRRLAAPNGWLMCDGSIVSLSTYQALYSLLGTTYGGNGVTTFGLPDYRSRLPIGTGVEGTNNYILGAHGGSEAVTLTSANIPAHTHQWFAATANASTTDPSNAMFAAVPVVTVGTVTTGGLYLDTTTSGFKWYNADASVITATGGAAVHENRMPIMALNFIICWQGLYPTRS